MPCFALAQTSSTLDVTPTLTYEVKFINDKPEVDLKWKVTQEDAFGFTIRKIIDGQKRDVVVYNPPTEGNYIGNSGFYVDLDVVQNQTYTYFVSAFNTLGQESAEASVTVNVVPPSEQQAASGDKSNVFGIAALAAVVVGLGAAGVSLNNRSAGSD